MCRCCGSKINKNWKPFDASETPIAEAKKSISILPLVLLLPLGAGAYFYWNFAVKEQPKPATTAQKAPVANAGTAALQPVNSRK